ncbi:MAG: MFS transporter [Alphaproteobacteria bacterium]|nr:MFS transporter [Alphaproteobacteria bacterium]
MRKNIYLFNIYHLCSGMWLFSPLAVIYFQEICQSYTLAIFAYSLISLMQSITEIPLGVISDRFGRKTNLILAAILLFLNMLFWAWAGCGGGVWMLFLGSALRGIGVSFLSGTDAAFIYETVSDLRSKRIFDKIYAKTVSYSQLGLLISAICATIVTYYLPIIWLAWFSLLPYAITIVVAFMLKEPKSNFDDKLTPWEQMKKSVRLLTKRKKLRNYTAMQVLSSGLTLSIYRFEILYYAQLIATYLITVVRIIMHTTGYISFMLVPMVRKFSFLNVLFLSNLGVALVRTIAIVLNNTLTPFVSAFTNLAYGVGITAQTALVQKEYNKSLRATMHSLAEFLRGFAIAIMGYIFGLIADLGSPRMALSIAIIAQLLVAMAYKRLFKMYKN